MASPPESVSQKSSQATSRALSPVAPLASLAAPSTAEGQQLPNKASKWPTDWRPYTAIFGGFLLMFNSWGLVNAYGTYSSYYSQYLMPDTSMVKLNLIGGTQSFLVLSLSAIVGRFLDSGSSLPLMIAGTFALSLGSFLLSCVNGGGGFHQGSYTLTWLTQGFLSGLGMACFFVTSSQVVATWFKTKKSLAIGMVACGASISGFVYPLMLKYLLARVGFNVAQRYVAALTSATSVLALFVARPDPTHPRRPPERCKWRFFVDIQALGNPAFCWFAASIFLVFFGFYAVFFNLEEWAEDSHLAVKDAIPGHPAHPATASRKDIGHFKTFTLLCILNGCSTVGRLVSAFLSDHVGALNVHATVTLVGSLLILTLWIMTTTLAHAIAFVVTYGVISGAVIGLPPASMAYILGPDISAQVKLGQWTGMMYTIAAIPALGGPPIAGYLIQRFGNNYLTVQCWSGICLFLSAGCMVMGIYYRRRMLLDSRESFAIKRRRLSYELSAEHFERSRQASAQEERARQASTAAG